MGTTVTSSGVSIQLCDADGAILGPPIFSQHVRILGQPSADVITRTGMAANAEELALPGSADWLTLVAIADSDVKLNQIVTNSGLPQTDAQTSGASRRVLVVFDTSTLQATLSDRITIASGPILTLTPPKMNVVHIKVLDAGAAMNADHPLKDEFVGQTQFFVNRSR